MASISLLDDLYFYQNRTTGQASANAVSIRQLCKILSNKTTLIITPDTLAWSTSSPDGKWTPLRDIPILKECCADWHYVRKGATIGQTVGPVGVKQLHQDEQEIVLVYSPQFDKKGWSPLSEHPDLALAIRAFDPLGSMPVIVDSDVQTKDRTSAVSTDNADEVQKELDAFLRSADPSGHSSIQKDDGYEDEEEEAYESDGGTNYIKDPQSGKWIHEALMPKTHPVRTNVSDPRGPAQDQVTQPGDVPNKKKRTRAKFAARNAKCWVYVSGLPYDTNEEEMHQVFSKAGILDLDPDTQKPKIKLYSTMDGNQRVLKGDGSLCFARPESVDLCIQLFHEAPFRLEEPTRTIAVEHAKFEQRGESYQKKAQSRQKRLVTKIAALQSIGWEDNEDNGRITGGIKGLTIVVLKRMFAPERAVDDVFLEALERKIRIECSEWGTVTKITIFASNPNGIVLVRLKEPTAASTVIEKFNGRIFEGTKVEAHFWDGVTDYAIKDLEEEQKQEEARLEEFGDWLDSHEELPDELRLKCES